MQLSIVDRRDHMSEQEREFARRRLLFALSRFDTKIDRVSLVVSDVNGPRGGIDKACRVTVKLRRSGGVNVKCEHAEMNACVARAAERAGRAVARAIAKTQQFDRDPAVRGQLA